MLLDGWFSIATRPGIPDFFKSGLPMVEKRDGILSVLGREPGRTKRIGRAVT
jgi:hypothetical protein